MLGSHPLEAVLGSGIDNTDHDAVRAFIRSAADVGLSLLFIYPDSKVPADLRTPAKRRADDKAAQQAARDAGHRNWSKVRSPSGLALATNDKTVLDRYLKRYIELFSTWAEVDTGQEVPYNKKRADAGEIVMTKPAAVNLAVEVGASGVVVVDCDTKEQMDRWFDVAEIGVDDRPAPTIITPGQRDESGQWAHRDGGHFWFTVPDKYRPALPRHMGALTWGGDHGFAVLWDRRYVLIPPSTRPEGAYEQVGHVYPLPEWLAEEIISAGEHRLARAERSHETANPEVASAVDQWAESVSWASILEPMGWTPGPRADSCGCEVWTAPGVHASPKSATAHDAGCALGRYTEVNAPLHLWTDHSAPPFTDHMDTPGWTPTFSKLQAVALIDYGGSMSRAMDALGLIPDKAVEMEPGLDARGPDADLDMTGDGDFDLPDTAGPVTQDEVDAAPDHDTYDTPVDRAAVLADLPADLGRQEGDTDSPYSDRVNTPDPDVFDSDYTGVPRIAPFSHWRDLPPPEFIIDGLIEHGGLSCIIGAPGVGKSSVALDMACHIATGKRWMGRTTLKTRVLYLPGEGLAGAVQRLRAWEAAHGVSLDDDLLLGNGIILVNAQNEAWGEITAYITRMQIGLVIFDTFARMSAGLEENSATDVGRAVRRFDRIKELTNAGVMVVHHTAKGSPDVARGSSALNGALDSELLVRPATWDISQIADENGRVAGRPIELWTSKQKNAEQLEDPLPLLMTNYRQDGINAPLITGPNGAVDPMQGEVVLARPLPEPVVETAIRIRAYLDRLPQQGATRSAIMAAVRPDAYANSRADAAKYWKQRIDEAVDRALRYGLIVTLTGTPSGARYIPDPAVTAEMARAAAAAEVADQD